MAAHTFTLNFLGPDPNAGLLRFEVVDDLGRQFYGQVIQGSVFRVLRRRSCEGQWVGAPVVVTGTLRRRVGDFVEAEVAKGTRVG